MPRQVSRRDFLKLGGLSLGVAAFNWPRWNFPLGPAIVEPSEPIGKGRVTIRGIYIYSDADFQSERLGIA